MATDETRDLPDVAPEDGTGDEENGAGLDRLQVLPLVALRDTVIFPEMIVPLQVGRDRSVKALDRAVRTSQPVALVTQRSSEQEEITSVDELYPVGTLAKIAQVIRLQDGTIRAIVQGQRRIRLLDLLQTEPHLEARVEVIDDASDKTLEIEALMASIHGQIEQYVNSGASVPPEVAVAARNISDGGLLADMTAYSPEMTTEQRQELLETIDIADRLRLASQFLAKQIEVLELKGRIQSEVKSEMDKTQREYILREQMKAIQKELGEDDPAVAEASELREKVEQSAMPDEVKERALKEVDRLSRIPSASPEQGVIRTYVDWLVSLPWGVETDDNLDLDDAEKILNEDHWGLEKVKERIVEYMAVRKLADKIRSPILLFVGPPGVGKTSLGKSIARAMGRKFVRMSLGGIHDEAEIRGHRRTYIGALPGRVIQNIKTAGSANPVFMLDEIDKVGMDFRGDPSSALLEVLDPEQNNTFADNYLEVPFDLSKVLFIATANMVDTIPPALRDRMEMIQLAGYTQLERVRIAERFLVPKQLEAHGLTEENLKFDEAALVRLIQAFTREAGVRNLEREIANVARKVARRVAGDPKTKVVVKAEDLEEYLGPGRFEYGELEAEDTIGMVTGLVVSDAGGDIVQVEATRMDGKDDFILTGQLGSVMQESARAGLSYIRARTKELGIDPGAFEKSTIHIHVPAGATPKDGPSAGVTMATAMASLLTGKPVRRDLAMTGEITLRGRVLPIGGLKSKLLAAHLAGVKTVLIPSRNEKDLVDVPDEVRQQLRIVPVENMDQVLAEALIDAPRPAARIKAEREERQQLVTRRPRRPRKSKEETPIAAAGDEASRRPAAGGPAGLDSLRPDGRPDLRRAPDRTDGLQGLLRDPRRPEDGDPGRDQEGVPQARARAPSGHEQGPRCREALQGGERGAGGPHRSGEAQAVRRARGQLAGVSAGRIRLGRRDRLGRLRRRSGRHAMAVPHRIRRRDGRLQRLLPPVLRRRCSGRRQPVRWRCGRLRVRRHLRPRRRRHAGPAAGHPIGTGERRGDPGGGCDRRRAHGQRQRATAPREDPARRERRLEGQAQRGGGRWRPRHQRAGQAGSPFRTERRRPARRAAADPGRGAPRRGGPRAHADRQREAAHPPEHAERPGDPGQRVAACRSVARRRRETWS